MHYWKGCIVLIGIFINAFQICGLQINFPQNNVGNYGESTEMNCTEAALDVSKGYNWYKDGSIIYNSVTGDATSTGKYTSSHGTDYFTLVITNTALNDNGVYRCNYNFQDDSDTLVIQAKGKFRTKLDCSKTVKEVEISWIDFYPNTATISSVKSKKGMTIPGNASTPVANGDFFNMTWTSANIDISDVKDGLDIEIDSLQDFSDFANITLLTTLLGLAIASLVLCLLGCFGLLGAVAAKFSCLKKVDNKILLGFVVFCLILLVISLGLGAAVLIDDDIECNKKYVGDIAIASLVISSIGIVGGIVIVVLIIVTNKSGKDGHNRGNDGHNGGGVPLAHTKVHAKHEEKSKASLVHAKHEEKSKGSLVQAKHEEESKESLSARADSDSAVSRQDVHVQENKSKISGRPMPPIPSRQEHDTKGRGLSANYDDDHPMISIGVPDKKAGDLGPLPEEQKKKKKKKRRTQEEDEYND